MSCPVGARHPYPGQSLSFVVRQLSQQDCIDQAEDRGICADAERERQYGDGGEEVVQARHAQAKTKALM
jgi:hypothetical protein